MAAMEDTRKSINGLPPPISTAASPLCLPVGSNPPGAMLSGDIKVRLCDPDPCIEANRF